MFRYVLPFAVLFCVVSTAGAQTNPTGASITPLPAAEVKDAQAVINTQFGSQFVLSQTFPILTGDFNADGSQDVLFVVTSRQAIQLETDRYRVLDPSSDYFGFGDPRITSQFVAKNPGPPRYLLIIHGSGSDGWHAKEPKNRFVIINMEFDRLSIGHALKKKKIYDDINLEETNVLNSFLYWNGRVYKWQPGAAEL